MSWKGNEARDAAQGSMIMKIRDSRFWPNLLSQYILAPSIAMCRVPEMELFSTIDLRSPTLDHCCGDGYIVAQVFGPSVVDCGVDIDQNALATASTIYKATKQADLGKELPYPDNSFATILNNSGIEHIRDLRTCLKEVGRVLKSGGRFYFNVLNRRYFNYWPLSQSAALSYRAFQPFYHALDEAEWRNQLKIAGLQVLEFVDYFDRRSSQMLARLDYMYSAHYVGKAHNPIIQMSNRLPPTLLSNIWRRWIGNYKWEALPGQGGGFLCVAEKR
jgi:SAM-dependent methyltransferase